MQLNAYIDHTILKPQATPADVEKLCAEAAEYGFASVCVNPVYVALAKQCLAGTDVKVCTVIGFPLGSATTQNKVAEAQEAIALGADELDMVIHVGALCSGNTDYVLQEIKALREVCTGKILKVIIEAGLLTNEQIATATQLTCQAGADFVKTCTGFSAGVATVEDVALMRQNLSGKTQIKASAGIKTYDAAYALVQAGATRIGTSAGVQIAQTGPKA